jgi:hypothetical protein
MKSADVNTVIEKFNSLELDEKEFAIDVLRKSYAETLREKLLTRSRKAMSNYRKGLVKRGDINELRKAISTIY